MYCTRSRIVRESSLLTLYFFSESRQSVSLSVSGPTFQEKESILDFHFSSIKFIDVFDMGPSLRACMI